ncbi:MAG: cytochrome c peroxidase [Saprospiraceae bacterium]
MKFILSILVVSSFICVNNSKESTYVELYKNSIDQFYKDQKFVRDNIKNLRKSDTLSLKNTIAEIHRLRLDLKGIDIWLRYFEPVEYKKINGPLPIEWEVEVFEKFEKPYRRVGSGLSLAENYLLQGNTNQDSLIYLLDNSILATRKYLSDSLMNEISKPENFILANRHFLLNLASIYTTGFECPDRELVIYELSHMLKSTLTIYNAFNISYPEYHISENYIKLFQETINFVRNSRMNFENFNHFEFIGRYTNPLFKLNQEFIRKYVATSISYNEYTFNNETNSIFDKYLYDGQDMLGVFRNLKDSAILEKIADLGKQLFYDPIFSANNKRACASCHKPNYYFTDTTLKTNFQYNGKDHLIRNTPSLVNVESSHLLMLDGKHFSMSNQINDVIGNPIELNSSAKIILKKILSCKDYNAKLNTLASYTKSSTPEFAHVISALTYFIGSFSHNYAEFDSLINDNISTNTSIVKGFNLFMGKAQCGTCHYVPRFSGVKSPFISNEFEVIGVPNDTTFKTISTDLGRFNVFPVEETKNSFRTPTLRNVEFTKPYMHNGVFHSLEQVMDFYKQGGGSGKGLIVEHQTLSKDSLNINASEINDIIFFLKSLSERLKFVEAPLNLPSSRMKGLNFRKVGGEY